MEKKTKARMVLYTFLALIFLMFFLVVQQIIVTIHPQVRAPPKQENIFQLKSQEDLEAFDNQLYDFTAKAIDMKEIVLVTGGSGFICSHFVDLLLREGYQVIVMDRNLNPTIDGNRENWGMNKGGKKVPSFIHVYGDVSNKDDVQLIPNVPIQYVFHCAGTPPPSELHTNATHLATPAPSKYPTDGSTLEERYSQRQSIKEQKETIRQQIQEKADLAHVESTRNLLNLFESRDYPVTKFMVLSTTDIYGSLAKSFLPFSKRKGMHNPPNPWAQSKLNMERFIQKTWRKRSMVKSHAIIRPTTVYGPRQTEGTIPHLINSALRGHALHLPMHGMYTRDFIHVADLVQSIYAVMLLPKGYVEVNVGSSVSTSLDDFTQTLLSLTSSDSPVIYSKNETPDIANQLADNNLVTPESPITVREGLEDTINYMKATHMRSTSSSPDGPSVQLPNSKNSFSIASAARI